MIDSIPPVQEVYILLYTIGLSMFLFNAHLNASAVADLLYLRRKETKVIHRDVSVSRRALYRNVLSWFHCALLVAAFILLEPLDWDNPILESLFGTALMIHSSRAVWLSWRVYQYATRRYDETLR